MKKTFTIYKLIAFTLFVFGLQINANAQCTTGGSQRTNSVYQAPAINQTVVNNQTLQAYDWDLYYLPGGSSYSYRFTNDQYIWWANSYWAYPSARPMTITVAGKNGDSVIATGNSPLTITVPKATTVKVRSHFNLDCSPTQVSGSYKFGQTLTTLYCGYAYRDADNDGYGDKNIKSAYMCPMTTIPTGYVIDSLDCNDANITATIIKKWYPDLDGDGFGDKSATPILSCTKPAGAFRTSGITPDQVVDSTDCDDTNPNINGKAHEVLGNNIDENCDNAININNALNFNRVGSNYVSIPNSNSIDLTSNFTLEAWVNTPADASSYTILDKGNYDYLWAIYGGKVQFYNRNTGSWASSTVSIPANTWTHVAVTFDNNNLTFYINGIASGTGNMAITYDNGDLNIGRQSPTVCQCNLYSGSIDELKIWKITRTANEIADHMNDTLVGNETGLSAYYTFNQGFPNDTNTSITSLIDKSPNANHGTFVNFTLIGENSNFVAGAPAFNIAPIMVTSVDDNITSNEFTIFPNPVSNILTVSDNVVLGQISISNVLGTELISTYSSASQINIDVTNLSKGVYFLKVNNKTTKFVKE